MKRVAWLGALVTVAAACAGAAGPPSAGPSGDGSFTPSNASPATAASATQAPPTVAPYSALVPTATASAHPTHVSEVCDVRALEDRLPTTILGAEAWTFSGRGIEGERSGRVEVAFLEALGAPDEAYVWAASTSLEGPSELTVQAFQVCGAAEDAVLDAFIATGRDTSIEMNLWGPVTARQATIEGTDIVAFEGQRGVLYLWAERDTVFAIWAPTHALATDVAEELLSR